MSLPFYVHQPATFALGNFINCTPTIRALADKHGERVPVLFETEYVRQCFIDCPFIEHITEPGGRRRLFGSDLKAPKRGRYIDCEWIYMDVMRRRYAGDPHTYVDNVGPIVDGDYIVLINGSGNERPDYVASKDLGEAPYAEALKHHDCVFVGSREDLARNNWASDVVGVVGNIRDALSAIAGAKAVIANDTGLAHAAGAMNKPLLVLWKNTPYPRCANPGTRTRYAFDNHVSAVKDFLSNIHAASSGVDWAARRAQKPRP